MSETWIFYLKYGSFVYLAKGMKVKLPSWELGLLAQDPLKTFPL